MKLRSKLFDDGYHVWGVEDGSTKILHEGVLYELRISKEQPNERIKDNDVRVGVQDRQAVSHNPYHGSTTHTGGFFFEDGGLSA